MNKVSKRTPRILYYNASILTGIEVGEDIYINFEDIRPTIGGGK